MIFTVIGVFCAILLATNLYAVVTLWPDVPVMVQLAVVSLSCSVVMCGVFTKRE